VALTRVRDLAAARAQFEEEEEGLGDLLMAVDALERQAVRGGACKRACESERLARLASRCANAAPCECCVLRACGLGARLLRARAVPA
jgi:hypothetical protein